MQISNLLLFVILCVICIYFTWNFFNNRRGLTNRRHESDIRYYELKAKYEFLVAVGTLFTAFAVFYGLSTRKDIEEKLKSDFIRRLNPTTKQAKDVETRVTFVEKRLSNAQTLMDKRLNDAQLALNSYYSALKELQVQQSQISLSSAKSKVDLSKYQKRVDSLNKTNLLKRNFYLVDNLTVNYENLYDKDIQNYSLKLAYDTLTTTLGDKLPKFKKPPIIVGVTDKGFGIHSYDVNTETFKVLLDLSYFKMPNNGILTFRLIITPGE